MRTLAFAVLASSWFMVDTAMANVPPPKKDPPPPVAKTTEPTPPLAALGAAAGGIALGAWFLRRATTRPGS